MPFHLIQLARKRRRASIEDQLAEYEGTLKCANLKEVIESLGHEVTGLNFADDRIGLKFHYPGENPEKRSKRRAQRFSITTLFMDILKIKEERKINLKKTDQKIIDRKALVRHAKELFRSPKDIEIERILDETKDTASRGLSIASKSPRLRR